MVEAAEEAQQELKKGIEAERYYDMADFIGSSKMSNWQKAALLARIPLQDASRGIQEYYKTAEAPGHSWFMDVRQCPGQEDSDIQLEIGLTKTSPPSFWDRPRNTLSEEDGTKLLNVVERAMNHVEWHRQIDGKIKNKELTWEEKQAQVKSDLTGVLKRLSSLNGVLVGDEDQFKPIHSHQAEGKTLYVPGEDIESCSGEFAQATDDLAQDSGDHLVSRRFILKSADDGFQITESKLISAVEDFQVKLEGSMRETGTRDVVDYVLHPSAYPCSKYAFLNALIQDAVRDSFKELKVEKPNLVEPIEGTSMDDTDPIDIRPFKRAAQLGWISVGIMLFSSGSEGTTEGNACHEWSQSCFIQYTLLLYHG